MSEKTDHDDFLDDDEDVADVEGPNVDRLLRSMDAQKRRKLKPGEEPAWRRLEDYLERKRTQALVEDFEDFDITDD
jgi:hypothetical protein